MSLDLELPCRTSWWFEVVLASLRFANTPALHFQSETMGALVPASASLQPLILESMNLKEDTPQAPLDTF